MKVIKQHVHGRLIPGTNPVANGEPDAASGRTTLLLLNANPEAETAESLYLCFALVVQGPEAHILPTVVKDDWGNERRGLDVYVWLEDEGHLFPRTELFGFDPDGTETQCFLRALELVARLPCYLYQSKNAAVAEGILLNAILLPDDSLTTPQKVKRPSHLVRPLANAAVNWWQVHPAITTFDVP